MQDSLSTHCIEPVIRAIIEVAESDGEMMRYLSTPNLDLVKDDENG